MPLFTLVLALSLLPRSTPVQEREIWSFGQYQVEGWYAPTGDRGYRILKDGQEVYSATPGEFKIISVSGGKQIDPPQTSVTDINGDGIPDLIMEEHPRQVSCCFSYSIFSLGPKFHQIANLTGFTSPMTFEDVNRDGIYEITGEDWTFTDWYSSPPIVFGYQAGEYRLATNLMRRPPPTLATLSRKAQEVSREPKLAGSEVTPATYEYILELIYSGNMQSAWQLLDLVWPKENVSTKSLFHDDFLSQLQKSPYWPEIRKMNGSHTTRVNKVNTPARD